MSLSYHTSDTLESIWGSGQEPRIPIWLDCDTGHDDAFAILLSATAPRFNLLGISTVHGNSSLENTTRNTLSILEAIGRRDIPVYPGAAKPICRDAVYAPSIHGESGLDGTTVLPEPVAKARHHNHGSTGAMYEALSKYPGKSWLVSTGTLTNIALAFAVYPQLVDAIAGLSIMGGAIGGFFSHAPMGKVTERLNLSLNIFKDFAAGLADNSEMTISQLAQLFKQSSIINPSDNVSDDQVHHLLAQARRNFGNTTPLAEFNIFCDPEAASSVFSNPRLAAKTTLVPLDLTHQVLTTSTILDRLSTPQSTLRQLMAEILVFFGSTYNLKFGMPDPPLHDPVAVAAALEPSLFDDGGGERFHVSVVRDDKQSTLEGAKLEDVKGVGQLGRTIAKLLPKGSDGVRIPRTLDIDKFWELIHKAIDVAEKEKMKQDATNA